MTKPHAVIENGKLTINLTPADNCYHMVHWHYWIASQAELARRHALYVLVRSDAPRDNRRISKETLDNLISAEEWHKSRAWYFSIKARENTVFPLS